MGIEKLPISLCSHAAASPHLSSLLVLSSDPASPTRFSAVLSPILGEIRGAFPEILLRDSSAIDGRVSQFEYAAALFIAPLYCCFHPGLRLPPVPSFSCRLFSQLNKSSYFPLSSSSSSSSSSPTLPPPPPHFLYLSPLRFCHFLFIRISFIRSARIRLIPSPFSLCRALGSTSFDLMKFCYSLMGGERVGSIFSYQRIPSIFFFSTFQDGLKREANSNADLFINFFLTKRSSQESRRISQHRPLTFIIIF